MQRGRIDGSLLFFWLFFGLLVPLILANPGGVLFPMLFAVGTAVPLLVLTGLIGAGCGQVGGAACARAGAWSTSLRASYFCWPG